LGAGLRAIREPALLNHQQPQGLEFQSL
jgi:hypothetical protein